MIIRESGKITVDLMNSVRPVSWDAAALGIPCYEIVQPTAEVFEWIKTQPGHYSVKVDPLSTKKLLHEHGFYYCDTLMETYCEQDRFIQHSDPHVALTKTYELGQLVEVLRGAFVYGRFHRDFSIPIEQADRRYELWLNSLVKQNDVFALVWQKTVVGFFAYCGNRIALHAIHKDFRGKGLAKYFWSAACQELFDRGHPVLVSFISAANISVLNLYLSLGFRFRNPVDVYHKNIH